MLRLILLGLFPILIPSNAEPETNSFTPVEEVFPIHWKADMGNVSFRNNILLTPNEIIIGSNGKYFMDYNFVDEKAGVYKINRKTGKQNSHFGNDAIGDMDVNGILQWGNRLYISNDNEELVCTTPEGKIIWSKPASGDIEHEPVLIEHPTNPLIVYATETGEVKAVRPENGETLWSYYTPDFSGWKPKDNRFIFKVKSYFNNTHSFYRKPIKADLNTDGIPDLIYLTFSGDTYAINGVNGKLLWRLKDIKLSNIEKIPFAKGNDFLLAVGWKRNASDTNNEYFLLRIKSNGQHSIIHPLEEQYFSSLNYYFHKDEILINTADHLITIKNNRITDITKRALMAEQKYSWSDESSMINRNHDDMLFSNNSFKYKNYGECIINLVQHDNLNYSKGFIEIIALTNKKIVDRLMLPESSEMQPLIGDINQDGQKDLLINCKDEYLYCYNLGVK
jgi:hypothetical protein